MNLNVQKNLSILHVFCIFLINNAAYAADSNHCLNAMRRGAGSDISLIQFQSSSEDVNLNRVYRQVQENYPHFFKKWNRAPSLPGKLKISKAEALSNQLQERIKRALNKAHPGLKIYQVGDDFWENLERKMEEKEEVPFFKLNYYDFVGFPRWLQSYRSNHGSLSSIFDMRSPEFVTVYRALIEPEGKLDLNINYVSDTSRHRMWYSAETVAHELHLTNAVYDYWTSGERSGAVVIEYKMPAFFLRWDDSHRDGARPNNPFYIIDGSKMQKWGVTPAVFVSRIGRAPGGISSERSVRWYSQRTVDAVIKRSLATLYLIGEDD